VPSTALFILRPLNACKDPPSVSAIEPAFSIDDDPYRYCAVEETNEVAKAPEYRLQSRGGLFSRTSQLNTAWIRSWTQSGHGLNGQ
jgi:hypothetical protein